MEKSPKYTPQVPYTMPKAPAAPMPQYQAPQYKESPMYESDDHEHKVGFYYKKETVKQFVGTWVHCHSMYGMHEGLVHRALRDGIILVHHSPLASGNKMVDGDVQLGLHDNSTDADFSQVQFVLPFPGLFVPYGGLYGLYPRPFIW